jgi:hypothetical protein
MSTGGSVKSFCFFVFLSLVMAASRKYLCAQEIRPTQTPAPNFNSIYLVLGDSYAAGSGTDSQGTPFWQLTDNALNVWYPTITWDHLTLSGCGPENWIDVLPQFFSDYKKKGLPVGYILFQVGPNCFFIPNSPDCPDCCEGATPSQAVSYSYAYKKCMSKAIGEIYAANPGVKLVVDTIPDPYNGTGKFTPTSFYQEYRKRLYELRPKYPQMRIADLFTVMYGHPEYFKPTADPRHPNDLGQKIVARAILEKFANWPYGPN